MIDVERVIRNAVIDLLGENPFFGHIICQFPKVFTDSMPTMAVGKQRDGTLINLYVNPRYVESLYSGNDHNLAFRHIVEVLKHEVLHVIFRHPWASRPDSAALAIACELSVNSYINRNRLIDKGVFPEDYGWARELGLDVYYELLTSMDEKTEPQTGRGGDDSSRNGGSGDTEGQPDNGSDSAGGDTDRRQLDSHAMWRGIEESEASHVLLKDIIRKAHSIAQNSRQWGELPGSLRRQVEVTIATAESHIPWQIVLRELILSSSETTLSYTNRRISRRFGTRPGTCKEDVVNLAVGVDTSGSIDYRMLAFFFHELDSICRQGVLATVFEGDTHITREYPYSQLDLSGIQGGGGTDLEPIIRKADERRFDALVYFTDGYAPTIEREYLIPVIFVVCGRTLHTTRKELPYPCLAAFIVSEDGGVAVAE